MSFLRRLARAFAAGDARVEALRAQAKASSDYASHVSMMRRCVDELHKDAGRRHADVQTLRGLLRSSRSDDVADQLEAASSALRDAVDELKKQKAELVTMEATQARQEERFADNKFTLLSEGFAVEDIALVPPDTEATDYEADRLIASFELEDDLEGRATPGLH